jgi:hypothetical protein|tara:strand:- start:2133 stop:2558 length:426 start_codon:yes stop_codon:yes gene_type:complete
MTIQILSRRSTVLHDRPNPIRIGAGEICVNSNPGDPGLFFADSTASPSTGLIKAGPTFVGSTQPNTPAAGFATFSKGESWLDTASTHILKIFDGSNFQTVKAVASVDAGKPANPVDGQLAYDTNAPGLFMYRASTGAWVAV